MIEGMIHKVRINEVKEFITHDIIKEFNNTYLYDHVPIVDNLNSCRIDYYHMIGEYHFNKGSNSNEFIKVLQENGYLGDVDLNNLNKYIEHIRIALTNFKRYLLLKDFKGGNDFSKKIDFVLNNVRFFNLFRVYNIPNYGKFDCRPTSLEEINTFIDLYQKSFYCTEVIHPLNNMNPYYENDKTSFFLSITNTNYSDVALRFLDKLDDRMCKLDDPERFFACYNIIQILNEKKIDIIELLKEANDPLLYYVILPLKNCVEDVILFQAFLQKFSWDRQRESILNTQNKAIKIVLVDPSNRWNPPIYDESTKYTIIVKSENESIFYENLKKSKIFIQDLEIIQNIMLETRKFLNSMNYVNVGLIDELIDFITVELDKLITPGVELIFKNHFLNAFSKIEIADFNSEVWNKFKDLLPFNQSKQKVDLDKIKTRFSAKQLALFIRLLIETEIIDNKKHKVEPLLYLISSYFSSIDKDDLSAGSLNKNYYAKDYHSDLSYIKAKMVEIQKLIDEMKKN